MNLKQIIIVPFITFGPIFMMSGVDYKASFLHTWSAIGAFMLAVGCGLIYIMVVNQEKKLKDVQEQLKKISESK